MPFNRKLKSSSSPRLLFCCFRDDAAAAAAYHEATSSDCDGGGNRNRLKAARSPCSWLRSTSQELLSAGDAARVPQPRRSDRESPVEAGHAAAAASEFGYYPMSYALNFEDDRSRDTDEEFLARNFSARLPASPDRLLPAKLPRGVVACS